MKDFKKSESLDTGFVDGNGIIWMFSGVILGLLVGLGMYYFANNKGPGLSSVDSVQKKIATAQLSASKSAQSRSDAKNNSQFSSKNLSIDSGKELGKNQAKNGTLSSSKTAGTREPRHNKFSYYAVLPTLDVPVGSMRPVKTGAKDLKVDKTTAEKVALLDAQDVAQETEVVLEGGYLLQVASFKRKDRANKTIKRLTEKGVSAYVQTKRVKGRLWYRVIAGPIGSEGIDRWKLKAEKLGHRPIIISVR